MTTITDLERHFVALFANEEAAIQWCSRPSKALTVSDGEFELICASRIKSAIFLCRRNARVGANQRPQPAQSSRNRPRTLGLGMGEAQCNGVDATHGTLRSQIVEVVQTTTTEPADETLNRVDGRGDRYAARLNATSPKIHT